MPITGQARSTTRFLQILTQAFEGVGSFDREAITDHLKNNTFKTIIGDVDIRNQKLNRYWTVGQWQDGFFHAVAGVGFTDYKPVRLKTGWVSCRRPGAGPNPAPGISFDRSLCLRWTSSSSACCSAAPTR